jgi:hypothetical protein
MNTLEGRIMKKAEADELQVTSTQQVDSPRCAHPILELARLTRNDTGYLIGTYHCRECGEASVHTHKSPAFTPLMD